MRDIGDLMSRAEFKLLTVDCDTITVPYPDAFVLMEHLRAMGEQVITLFLFCLFYMKRKTRKKKRHQGLTQNEKKKKKKTSSAKIKH